SCGRVVHRRLRLIMQYYFFHLMPWPYLPADFDAKYDSAWVWLPNSLYDPVKGHELYREYINTLAYAEKLGFDGICVNEHHQNAYGLMPSPNIIAGALTQRTTTCKIVVIGNALPLYNPPLRVAEEFAMLDVMSGGRLNAGMVIGGGPEYYSYGINPTRGRGRCSSRIRRSGFPASAAVKPLISWPSAAIRTWACHTSISTSSSRC